MRTRATHVTPHRGGGAGKARTSALLETLAALASLIVLAGCGEREASSGHAAGAIVFTVFDNLPPSGACDGLHAVDPQSGRISFLGGWRAKYDQYPHYPQFTSSGRLSYAYFVEDSQELPLADVFVGRRRVARTIVYGGWKWSPTRDELLFARLDGHDADLVVGGLDGRERVIGRPAELGFTWLPDGESVVYVVADNGSSAIASVGRDGTGRRILVRNAFAPLPSPDGRRLAYLRRVDGSGSGDVELWVSDIDGGDPRRLVARTPSDRLLPALWVSNHELLVQRGGEHDDVLNAGDELHELDVDIRHDEVFLRHALAIRLSPARDRLLFARRRTIAHEWVYAIHTIGLDGRGDRELAIVDEEDLNIRSVPAWQPRRRPLERFGDRPPRKVDEQKCVRLLREAMRLAG